MAYANRPPSRHATLVSGAKAIVSYLQLTGNLKESSSNTEWPQEFSGFIALADAINAGVTSVLGGISCSMRAGYLVSFQLQMLLPVAAAVAIVGAWAAATLVLRRGGAAEVRLVTVKNLAYSTASTVAFLLFPGLCSAIFTFLKCHEVQGR